MRALVFSCCFLACCGPGSPLPSATPAASSSSASLAPEIASVTSDMAPQGDRLVPIGTLTISGAHLLGAIVTINDVPLTLSSHDDSMIMASIPGDATRAIIGRGGSATLSVRTETGQALESLAFAAIFP